MSGCAKCSDGWIEVDDMPVPCRNCIKMDAMAKAVEYTKSVINQGPAAKPVPVAEYLAALADAMGLGNWEFVIDDEAADDGNIAEIDCTVGQRHARVYLCEDWADQTPVMQRDTLVHELVHAHLSQLRHMIDSLCATVKGGKQIEVALNLLEEYATESIAQAWAPHLPVPAPTKKKGKK